MAMKSSIEAYGATPSAVVVGEAAKSRAPLYVGLGLLVFGLILIAIGLSYRRFGAKDKEKPTKPAPN